MLFQIGLATLDTNRNKLLAVRDDGEAMTVLGNYLEHVTNRDSTMVAANQGGSSRNSGVPSTGVGKRWMEIYSFVHMSQFLSLFLCGK